MSEENAPARRGVWQRFRKPEEARVDALAATAPILWAWVVALSLALYQIYFDPLGFSRLTQRYSQDLVNLTLTGPLYPSAGQDAVSVALIEDDTLQALGMQWPWSYGDHARALEALLAYRPRAVAIDILFADARSDPSLEQLLLTFRRYRDAGIPIYVVGSPVITPPVRSEVTESGVPVIDSTILFDAGVARQYPESVACLDGRGACPSFAVRIYKDAFGREVRWDEGGRSHIELVWATDTNPINRKWMRVADENGRPQACAEDRGVASRFVGALIDAQALRTLCPHTGVIPAELLMRGDEDADISTLVKNRVVFYGASLEGSADKAYTPANGLIAGVFVHAMALDNLVSFNGHPKRDTVSVAGVLFDNNAVQSAVIALILLTVALLHERRRRPAAGQEGTEPPKRHRLSWYSGMLTAVVVSGIILYVVFGLSIGNWVELVFISGALFELMTSEFPARLWGRARYALHI